MQGPCKHNHTYLDMLKCERSFTIYKTPYLSTPEQFHCHKWVFCVLTRKKIKIRAVKNSHTTWNSLCLLDRVLGSIWILSSYCSYHTVYWNIFFHFHYVCWSAEHRGFIYILHLNSDCSWVLEWAQVEESRVHVSIGSFHFQNIQVFIFKIQCLGREKKTVWEVCGDCCGLQPDEPNEWGDVMERPVLGNRWLNWT